MAGKAVAGRRSAGRQGRPRAGRFRRRPRSCRAVAALPFGARHAELPACSRAEPILPASARRVLTAPRPPLREGKRPSPRLRRQPRDIRPAQARQLGGDRRPPRHRTAVVSGASRGPRDGRADPVRDERRARGRRSARAWRRAGAWRRTRAWRRTGAWRHTDCPPSEGPRLQFGLGPPEARTASAYDRAARSPRPAPRRPATQRERHPRRPLREPRDGGPPNPLRRQLRQRHPQEEPRVLRSHRPIAALPCEMLGGAGALGREALDGCGFHGLRGFGCPWGRAEGQGGRAAVAVGPACRRGRTSHAPGRSGPGTRPRRRSRRSGRWAGSRRRAHEGGCPAAPRDRRTAASRPAAQGAPVAPGAYARPRAGLRAPASDRMIRQRRRVGARSWTEPPRPGTRHAARRVPPLLASRDRHTPTRRGGPAHRSETAASRPYRHRPHRGRDPRPPCERRRRQRDR